jgi:GTP-binding protein LepA
MANDRIRNFSIIAHIDHGKSTLADRLLEKCGALNSRKQVDQVLDKMELERERGITIKAQTVRLNYKAKDGKVYLFNLIDTPGHVDFTYEVSRSLAACEGAILVVDATQGVEAQTLANVYMALDADLEIMPVLNKIDLPSAQPEKVAEEIEEIIGIDAMDAVRVSAKEGIGIDEVLEAIVKDFPHPEGDPEAPLKALIFDSWFDNYQGAVVLFRVVDGTIRKGDRITMMGTGKSVEVDFLYVFTPEMTKVEQLEAGEVGSLTASIKQVSDTRIGDTITSTDNPTKEAFSGFKLIKPMVFSGLYPTEPKQYDELKDSLEKLGLNDSSFVYEPETSAALGFGFRCGFLGLLHMDIIRERLEREFALELITTAPTVVYRVTDIAGEHLMIDNPTKLPDPMRIEMIEEPFIIASIYLPGEFVGAVMALCQEKRGLQRKMQYLRSSDSANVGGLKGAASVGASGRVLLEYELPLSEVVYDFYDRLKSVSRGYASLDYELHDYQRADLVKLDVLVNDMPVDALSLIVHRDRAQYRGRDLVMKLRRIIPRQMFEVVLQAAIGKRVVARETIKALRKNVTAKCYGGDISRKRKLLEKQKEGKKRMKQVGNVELPQEAFLAVLSTSDDKK